MTSFSKELVAFSQGELSADELLLAVQRSVAAADDAETVLALLDAHTRLNPLPPEVRTAIEQRIVATVYERQTALRRAGETSVPSGASSAADDATRLQAPTAHKVGVGDTIARRFVLEALLGRGGMGHVFKALDLRRREAQDRAPYVAIKVLSESFRQHPAAFMVLQREAKKALSLAHPNIIRVFDFDRDGDTIFMTMEYLSGQSLEQVIKAPGFAGMPFNKAMQIIAPMGSALAFAHDNDIVHCDFKPSNVFITDREQVKVIDFGIARAIHRGDPEIDQTVFDVSALRALTPAYASPEMIDGLEPDPRDDVYAFACVTYELLTGRHPFHRASATVARAQALAVKAPPQLTRRQWAGLQQALALERERRTGSVKAVLESLSPTGGVRSKSVVFVAAAVTAAVAVGGGVAYYLATGTPPPRDLASIVASVPCSVLTATADDRSISVVGYAGNAEDVQAMEAALRKLDGSKTISSNVLQWIDAQHCAPIDLLKPYLIANLRQDAGLRVHLPQSGIALRDGEPLPLAIATPGQPSVVGVDYFAVDGTVSHLLPMGGAQAVLRPALSTVTLADAGGKDWPVRPPYGTQLLVVVSAPEPLFDRPRPVSESTHEYLAALGKSLAAWDAGAAVFADFDFLRVVPAF